MNKWIQRVTAPAALSVLLLAAACGGNGAGNTAGNTAGESPSASPSAVQKEEVKKKDPVTLTYTTFQGWRDEALDRLIEMYEEESGNKVELTTFPDNQYENVIRTKLASGDAPDVFQFYSNGTLLPGELIESLDDSPWVANLIFPKRYQRPSDGKVITAPLGGSQVQGIVYNKEVFKKAGIESAPRTYTEFVDAAEKIKAIGVTPIYLNNKDAWSAQLYFLMAYSDVLAKQDGIGDKLLHNQVKLQDVPGIVETTEKIMALKDKGYLNEDFNSATYQMAFEALEADQVGMWATLSQYYSTMSEDYPEAVDKLGMFPFTASDTDIHALIAPSGNGNYISASSKHKDAAKEFIDFLMSDKAQEAYFSIKPGIPPFKGMDSFEANPWEKQMQEYAKEMPIMNAWNNEFTFEMNSGDLGKLHQDMFMGKEIKQSFDDWYRSIVPLNQARSIEGW
ncbi:ABC transporter substrate-binding protein [Cohnella cellulosilytica]|uniref:ABC transporter substrate-binding protein n=1 Tax=Cohnella cellulosilytica TaxID=986710 RepID=A0ABW2F626_9BACL